MTAISTKAAHSSARSGAPTAQTLGCPQEVSRKPAFRQNCMIDEMQYTHGGTWELNLSKTIWLCSPTGRLSPLPPSSGALLLFCEWQELR